MAITRYSVSGDSTALKNFLDLLKPKFFADVSLVTGENSTVISCSDSDGNILFKFDNVSNTRTYYAYRAASNSSSFSNGSATGDVKYAYIVGDRGAVLTLGEINGSIPMIIISKTSTNKTGIVMPTTSGATYCAPVCWGDDPALTTELNIGGTMIGNQCLFVPIPLHGQYDSAVYLPDAFFMPMAQSGIRGEVQQLTSGAATYLTNGYFALMDV